MKLAPPVAPAPDAPTAPWPLVAARQRLAVVLARADDVAPRPAVTVAQVEWVTQPLFGVALLIDGALSEAERDDLPAQDPEAYERLEACRSAVTKALNQLALALSSATFGNGRQAAREVADFRKYDAPALDAALVRATAS